MKENSTKNKEFQENQNIIIVESVSLNTLNETSKSICKIIIEFNNKIINGTGFFMKFKDGNNQKRYCLITNYHIIPQEMVNLKITIKIKLFNGKEINIELDSKQRFIKCLKKPIDISAIEILNSDKIKNDIKFLDYDLNYIEGGYNQYFNKDVFILQHPEGKDIESANGKIGNINDYEFEHSVDTFLGSSGSPVILIENSRVIGIHKKVNKKSKCNMGTFIGKFIKELNEQTEIEKKISDNKINERIDLKEEEDLITLKYKIDNNNNDVINIFNKNFAYTNHNYCKIYINNEEYKLCPQIKKEIIRNNECILEVKLKQLNEFCSISEMFKDCDLLSLSRFPKFKEKINKMNGIFSNCKYLSSLPDKFELNTERVEDMHNMFKNCISLLKLPDISEWNTSNVTDMSKMFSSCEKLESLPDISKWDTSNVINMNHMFNKCKSLLNLPDISKWNTKKVENMGHLFSSCENLKSLPNISSWSVSNVKNMSSMFYECKSLESIPDISKWKTKKVNTMNLLFASCKKVKKLPNIQKWKTNELTNMNDIYLGSESLESLPNTSRWNKKKVKNKKKIMLNINDLDN